MNKKGFTLIELLAVIVVLGVIMVIAVSSVLPMAHQSREQAFRIEATAIVEASETVKELLNLKQINLSTTPSKDNYVDENGFCITVENLKELGYYTDKDTDLKGEIYYSYEDQKYTLFLQKGVEFSIVDGQQIDYRNAGNVNGNGFDINIHADCSKDNYPETNEINN